MTSDFPYLCRHVLFDLWVLIPGFTSTMAGNVFFRRCCLWSRLLYTWLPEKCCHGESQDRFSRKIGRGKKKDC